MASSDPPPYPLTLKDKYPWLKSKKFQEAILNVPNIDIDCILKINQNQEAQQPSPWGPLDAKKACEMAAFLRWASRICDQCCDKSRPEKLLRCGKCNLAFYCSRECQRAAWTKHQLRCGKTDTKFLDDGPQKLVFLQVKEEEKQPQPPYVLRVAPPTRQDTHSHSSYFAPGNPSS